ncbi:HypC/HybG/HupF family hydrogenase formation chaperone [Motiliproteus sp. SC1-56]|uniref:HypC/HybG/HupF family hydrogenase formation chaperone n=1 Tax=Motiliproteus sp. SC1-56 TaxID=2799565 RepID=UPI001A8DBE05|nr:HypC/HybG/HupF family hydrogenase formation chaperone [Motiliproteus sp. SC1-56]
MCIGVPSKVVALDGQVARVESLGESREVSLILMDEPVALGDYLLIQVGNFAVEKIDKVRAEEALAYLAELDQFSMRPLGQGDAAQ